MFRKNYLPKMNVYQDIDGKWFASDPPTSCLYRCFVQCTDGKYGVSKFGYATKFDTLELLMQGLYEFACYEHTEAIKEKITYSKVKVAL